MRTASGLTVPAGAGGTAGFYGVRRPRSGGKPIRPEPEVKGRYVVPASGYGRARKVEQRKHLTAKSVVPGKHRLIGSSGTAYDVLAKVEEGGYVVLTVKSLANGNERTWRRRPGFHCEYC